VVPDTGTITLGESVLFSQPGGVSVAPHLRRVGYVFQDLALWPHLTALAQVTLVGRSVGLEAAGAVRLLTSVGLDKLRDRRPAELSGGEQQRLAIARALAAKPTILLLDEPFSSADPETRASLYDLVREASVEISGPTIYVTHNAEDAHQLVELAIKLADGQLVVEERPWERQPSEAE
jgi:molybdate transport system ATP-binding protein